MNRKVIGTIIGVIGIVIVLIGANLWGVSQITGVIATSSDSILTEASDIERLQKCFDEHDFKFDVRALSEIEIFPPGKYKATIWAELSASRDINQLGWYYNETGCGALYQLFKGEDGSGTSVEFETVNPFGLYLNSPTNPLDWHKNIGGLYYSDEKYNLDGIDHFRIYVEPETGNYVIAVEDWCGGGDRDYDDIVVHLERIVPPYPWPMFHHDLRHIGYSTSIAPDTDHRVWVKDISSGITSSPAIIDGKVFITSEKGRVYCLDESTGALIWDQSIGGGYGWSSSPAVHDNKVFVGANDGKVYCLDANSGGIIWDYQTGGNVESSPAVANDKVFIGSRDGHLYCLNETTGSFIWSYPTGEIHMSSPAVADGKVFIGSYDHNVYCLDEETGSFIWSFTTGINIESSPTVIDNKVFIGGLGHYFYCLDEATGTLLWSYFVGDDERIWSTPAVADGKVFFGSSVGYGNEHGVYCLNETTGSFIWKYSTENHVESSPAVADGKVYFGSRDKYVYCVDEMTGALIWRYETGNIIYSSPAIANGKVIIGSHDNKVYAFAAEAKSKFVAHFWTPEGGPYPVDLIISDGIWRKEFKNVTYIETEVPCNASYLLQWETGDWEMLDNFKLLISPGEIKKLDFCVPPFDPENVTAELNAHVLFKERGANLVISQEYFHEDKILTVDVNITENTYADLVVPLRILSPQNETTELALAKWYINGELVEDCHIDISEHWKKERLWPCKASPIVVSPDLYLYGSGESLQLSLVFEEIDTTSGKLAIVSVLHNDRLFCFNATLTKLDDPAYLINRTPKNRIPSFYNIIPGSYGLTVYPEEIFNDTYPTPLPITLPVTIIPGNRSGESQALYVYPPIKSELKSYTAKLAAEFAFSESTLDYLHDPDLKCIFVNTTQRWPRCPQYVMFVLPKEMEARHFIVQHWPGEVLEIEYSIPADATEYCTMQVVGDHRIHIVQVPGGSNETTQTAITLEYCVSDTFPPSAVTDLATSNPTLTSITLTWTAPGDDGNTGTASEYDIRYSTSPITEANWDAATRCIGEPAPQPAGSSETFTVTSLSRGTTYYFALKTADEVPNWPQLSNVASGKTLSFVTPPPTPI